MYFKAMHDVFIFAIINNIFKLPTQEQRKLNQIFIIILK